MPLQKEVERCGIRHQSAGELCDHCQNIQRCKITQTEVACAVKFFLTKAIQTKIAKMTCNNLHFVQT